MPTINLTRSASSAGNSGWYPIDDEASVVFQYDSDETLGGAGIEITQIRINGRARNASSATKQLCWGFKPSLSSGRNEWSALDGAVILDAAFTVVPPSSSGFTYRAFTRVYDASTNSGMFQLFSGHIREAFSQGNPIFLGIIQPRASFETQIDLLAEYWTISIDYELLGNVPTVNVSTAKLGQTTITTTLIKVVSGSGTTIRYKIGENTLASYNIGAASSHEYVVPVSAGNYFPDTQTGELLIEAETFVGEISYGTVAINITLTLPDDAAPTCDCALTRIWLSTIAEDARLDAYIQSKSGVQFSLEGAAKYGASVAAYALSIENKTYSGANVAHLPIAGSGIIPYSYTVTDSRGLSKSYTGSIDVIAWSMPTITTFGIARAAASGETAVDGTYALATIKANASTLPVNGEQKNHLEYYIQYRLISNDTEAEWTDGDASSLSAIVIDHNVMLQKNGESIGSFDNLVGYEFRLVVSDIYTSVTAMDSMPTKISHLDINETNGSMGFGGDATGNGEEPEYDFYGLIRARKGIDGLVAIEATENGHAIKFGVGSGLMIQAKKLYTSSYFRQWGELFYCDIDMGAWDVPFETLIGATCNVGRDILDSAMTGCSLNGASATHAGYVRMSKGTSYDTDFTVVCIGIGTWSETNDSEEGGDAS